MGLKLKARVHLGTAVGLTLLTMVAGVRLLQSEDTLTDRVAVEQVVFDQRPDRFTLFAGGRRLELLRSPGELEELKAYAQIRGLEPRSVSESDIDFALRAARWVQGVVPHGQERKSYFRGWGFRKVMAEIGSGEKFWCGTYARLLAALALSEGIPARSIWMKGHVTSEVYSSNLDKWVVVDAMYNHILRDGDRYLSAIEVHALLKEGRVPHVAVISDEAGLDEPVKATFTEVVAGVYGGGIFRVFDGDINFSTDLPHLLLPAMSLKTDADPTGTSPDTRALWIWVPLLGLLALAASLMWLIRAGPAMM